MAKKAELLAKAAELKLSVTEKNTITEIESAIAEVENHEVRKADTAKAGKRSKKALEEVEAKIEKEERKATGDTTPQDGSEPTVKKGPKPVTRPLIERRGKSYRAASEKVEKGKLYDLAEALKLAAATNPAKFDASVEIHARLGVDPRQADQNIRSTVSLPNGTGKTIRVAVFAPEADHKAAKAAGADIVGDETFIKQLEKEAIDFDILISTPAMMPKLGKFARLLGPRGLMPNPKAGTVATDVAKAVAEAKAGKVEYRVDKQSIVHLSIGKVSFGDKKLLENAESFLANLSAQKPGSLKGAYILSLSVSTTMGPGIKVQPSVN